METFLQDGLKLNTAKTNSGLKHQTETVRCLGYDIIVQHTDSTVTGVVSGQHCKKRALVGQIKCHMPAEKLQGFSDQQA